MRYSDLLVRHVRNAGSLVKVKKICDDFEIINLIIGEIETAITDNKQDFLKGVVASLEGVTCRENTDDWERGWQDTSQLIGKAVIYGIKDNVSAFIRTKIQDENDGYKKH